MNNKRIVIFQLTFTRIFLFGYIYSLVINGLNFIDVILFIEVRPRFINFPISINFFLSSINHSEPGGCA